MSWTYRITVRSKTLTKQCSSWHDNSPKNADLFRHSTGVNYYYSYRSRAFVLLLLKLHSAVVRFTHTTPAPTFSSGGQSSSSAGKCSVPGAFFMALITLLFGCGFHCFTFGARSPPTPNCGVGFPAKSRTFDACPLGNPNCLLNWCFNCFNNYKCHHYQDERRWQWLAKAWRVLRSGHYCCWVNLIVFPLWTAATM